MDGKADVSFPDLESLHHVCTLMQLLLTGVERCIFVTLNEHCVTACAGPNACAVETATAGKIWSLFVFARDIL